MHYQPQVQTKESLESSMLLAQDPMTYIDKKLAEFCNAPGFTRNFKRYKVKIRVNFLFEHT